MAKIMDGEIKLNSKQVVEKIVAEEMLTDSQKALLGRFAWRHSNHMTIDEIAVDARQIVCHAILDAYKYLLGDTDKSVEARKCLLFLVTKYMKSTVMIDGENTTYLSMLNGWYAAHDDEEAIQRAQSET